MHWYKIKIKKIALIKKMLTRKIKKWTFMKEKMPKIKIIRLHCQDKAL